MEGFHLPFHTNMEAPSGCIKCQNCVRCHADADYAVNPVRNSAPTTLC
jgi:hypothetical protein